MFAANGFGFWGFDENAQECQSGTHQIWIQHPKIYEKQPKRLLDTKKVQCVISRTNVGTCQSGLSHSLNQLKSLRQKQFFASFCHFVITANIKNIMCIFVQNKWKAVHFLFFFCINLLTSLCNKLCNFAVNAHICF